MQIVYHAAHSADAQLVRGLLAQEGIQSFVFGGALEGGAGLLPVGGSVRVEVADEDAARAREIIEEWQDSAVPLSDDDDEEVDRDFGDDNTPEHAEGGNVYRPLNQRKSLQPNGFGMGGIVIALIVGALLGALATGLALGSTRTTENVDSPNGNSKIKFVYDGDKLVRAESDRNGDGKVDEIVHYDASVLVSSVEQDDDFDGIRETTLSYRDNRWAGTSADYDGNGNEDYRETLEHGVLQSVEWLDPQGRVIKRNTYTGGRLSGGKIDTDGDGELDTARIYDAHGELKSSQPLQAR